MNVQFNVDGIVYTTEFNEGLITEKCIFDLKTADKTYLPTLGLLSEGGEVIDITKSVVTLTACGYTCK